MIGTAADLRTYAIHRGALDVGSGDDAMVEAALQRGSDYITYNYVANFMDGYDETSPLVLEAVYEAAILEFKTPGLFNKVRTPGQDKVLVQVENIRWQPLKSSYSQEQGVAVSPRIEAMLRSYMTPRLPAVMVV